MRACGEFFQLAGMIDGVNAKNCHFFSDCRAFAMLLSTFMDPLLRLGGDRVEHFINSSRVKFASVLGFI